MKLWKDFRTNMMYWRFRHVTRNRLRLRSWWGRRRPRGPVRSPYAAVPSMRPRGGATYVYRSSSRRTWIAFSAMVLLLTALTVYVNHTYVNPGIVYGIGALIVVGAIYWSLRGA